MEKHVRTRPHDTHIPQQHIDKLGQFIYIRLTHYIAPARLAGIMLRGLYPVGICIYFHTAELVTIKLPAVQPVPFLAEEQRAAGMVNPVTIATTIRITGKNVQRNTDETTMSKALFSRRFPGQLKGSGRRPR